MLLYNVVVLSRTTFFCALLLACAWPAQAQFAELHWADPALHWRTLETEHFSVHFAEHYRTQAHIAAATAEKIYPRVTSLLDWQPRKRTHLVLLDSGDFANGFASPVPFNFTGIFLSPPDEGELLQNRDWLELVLSHEFFHVVHLDKASERPLALRDVLGRLLPFFPNVLQPAWIIEGLAVYNESEAASGYGRLGHSYFDGMMRAETARGLRSLREVNAEGRGFPINRDYLYGSYFFAFLRERYGEKAVRGLIDNYSANVVPFKVQSNAIAVTGKGMDELWMEYHDWLRGRFAAGTSTVTQGEIVLRAFSISSPVLTADARWYIEEDGYTRPRLMRQADGERPRAIVQTERDTRMVAGKDGQLLMAELDICGNHNLLYHLSEVDEQGKRRQITRCERDRLAAVLGDGRLVTVRVLNGEAQVLVHEPTGPRTVYRARKGESISGLAAKGDRIVVSALRNGRWALLDVTDGTGKILVSDEAVKHSPHFGDSADEVFFVADYGKTYDVWSLRLRRANLARWSRAAYGVREISAPVGGQILLTTIEADGDALRLLRLPAEPLEQRAARSDSSPEPSQAGGFGDIPDQPYSPWPSLRPTAWAPIVQIADGAVALGALTYGIDALELHQYFIAPMWEFTQRELLGRVEYLYDGRHGLLANRTLTVRDSDPGGSRSKIKAYSVKEDAQWVSVWRSLRLNRRLYWGIGAALEQEDFHDLQLGTSRAQNERVVGLVAGLDSRRSQWLSEGPSEGHELRLYAETSRGLGAAYDGNVYRADWRGHLPFGKTVLAARWNEAYGQRSAEAFELGGSKSDDVILLPVLNERDFALRGYTTGMPELMGHRARVASLEWRAPLADVDRHLMVPPVGLNRIALNVFVDVGAAWDHGAAPDYHRGIGAELMTEPRFGYLFGLQARAGVAKGLDEGGSTKIYLRAGRSF